MPYNAGGETPPLQSKEIKPRNASVTESAVPYNQGRSREMIVFQTKKILTRCKKNDIMRVPNNFILLLSLGKHTLVKGVSLLSVFSGDI